MTDRLDEAYTVIVQELQKRCSLTYAEHANYEGSGPRAAKAIREMCWSKNEIQEELNKILGTSFPSVSKDSPIIQSNIDTISMCPHHLLPVIYNVSIGYVPHSAEGESKVLGLSKLTRLARVLAKRPVVQEQYTQDIVHAMTGNLTGIKLSSDLFRAKHAQTVVTGVHSCMLCRGVNSNSLTTTIAGAPDDIENGKVDMLLRQFHRHTVL
jgi:GTP cyclohydrolase I